jgi:beta-glucosidase
MSTHSPAAPCYKDPARSEAERVADLLARMTVEEKCMQLRLVTKIDTLVNDEATAAAKLGETLGCGLGASYCTGNFNPEHFNRVQRYLVEETRLGIPTVMMGESLHGCMFNGATVFPQAIGLGSTWNTALMSEVAATIGRETRATGIAQTYAPNLDLSRDPRWGRVEENYGEDPYLTARLGVAYVRALQSEGVAASPKHYCAHGTPEGGINLGPVHAGERELRELFLPPFAAAIQEAGAMSLMPAYSELDGIPLHASRFLMTEILRDELGFDGFTVSDFGAVQMLHSFHKVAATPLDAGKQALWAGIDMEAPSRFGFGDNLIAAVKTGDVAVSRILRIKIRLGLFETPYADAGRRAILHDDAAVALTRQTARESMVLLKNDGPLLPLSDTVGRVALIGPNAAFAQLGDYTAREASDRAVTVRQGLEARLGADRFIHAHGCSIAGGSDAGIAEAVAAARTAAVAILVLGDNSNYHGGVGWGDTDTQGPVAVTCGEGFDLSDLRLPGRQQELLEAVAATGTPVVLVLMSGRPYAITWAAEHIPAILQVWYPGEQGGHAVCDLLFGDANPSGKLPISFPRSAGHIPCCYNHKVSARGYYKRPGTPATPGRDYVFSTPSALYPFGHGLSYTTFAYGDLKAAPGIVAADGTVEISVTVQNTGGRAGAEVVQLYLTDCYSRITPFVKRLRGFEKVMLEAGERRRVSFTLDARDFAFINEKMQPEVEAGTFRVAIGDQQSEFEVR